METLAAASSGATRSAARRSSTSASSQRPCANRARPAVAVRNGLCHRPSPRLAASSAPSKATWAAASSFPERLEQPGQRGVTARHLIHPADRLGDPTGLGQLLHASLEVAEKRQVHPQGPTRIPLL